MNTYTDKHSFLLECGRELPELTIAYHTYGKLNERGDNCIWVCHALTADSNVAEWWPHTVEKEKFLDPDKYFIVCANILGSCYGTTGPTSINPDSGSHWYKNFPPISIRDMAKAHIILAEHLGLSNIKAVIGSSLGGFQALEMAVMKPGMISQLILIATGSKATPWCIAIDESQRMSIFADKTYGEPHPKAATEGLGAARALALLTYRGPEGYNKTQQDRESQQNEAFTDHRACSYQRHQGYKLQKRFDAYSYVTILNAFDSHDIGRNRGGVEKALASLKMPALCIGISTDILFPPNEMKELATKLQNGKYEEIISDFGHDGFLVEHDSLNSIIKDFME